MAYAHPGYLPQGRTHGRGRGRGHGRGRGVPFWENTKNGDEDIRPQGIVLDSFKLYDVQSALSVKDRPLEREQRQPWLTAEQYVGSYNWSEASPATILVPGRPPRWSPPNRIPSLHQDQGAYFRDKNGARWPQYPIEPLVRTLYIHNQQFDPAAIDVVGCGSTLGNLLRCARGIESSFHFKAEVVGRTLFLVRQEDPPTALIEGVYGYGHTYPEAYTTWDAEVKGSASHQRLVTYTLDDDLTVLIRTESDGYLPSQLPKPRTTKDTSDRPTESQSINDLLGPMSASRVTSAAPVPGAKLKIQRPDVDHVPQEAVFDLKTRSARFEFDFEDVLPRLWLNRTPNFVLAQHNQGRFHEAQIIDIRQQVASWEDRNRDALKQFVAILRRLHHTLSTLDGSKAGIWRLGNGSLEVRSLENKKWSVLRPNLQAKWAGSEIPSGDESSEGDDESGDDSFLDF